MFLNRWNENRRRGATAGVWAAYVAAMITAPAIGARYYTETPPAIVGEDGSLLTPTWSGLTRQTSFSRHRGVGADVAIVAAASGDVTDALFTDVSDKLLDTGFFNSVTIIHAGLETPELSDLLAFDAVLVWSNFDFYDPEALGDVLVEYVDDPAGGGVVEAVFGNTSDELGRYLAGRWLDESYNVIEPLQDHLVGPAALGTVVDPGHPLLSGVSQFSGGTGSFRPAATMLHASGSLLASWDDGQPLVAVREDLLHKRVDLGMYPPSSDASSFCWGSWSDGDRLLANALVFASEQSNVDIEIRLVSLLTESGVSVTDDPALLPNQLAAAECADNFVLEIWASDVGVLNTGLTGVYVDLHYDPQHFQAGRLGHSPIFNLFASGSVDHANGEITNFGGNSFDFMPYGLAPEWVKIGSVRMDRLSTGPSLITGKQGAGGVGVFGRQAPPPSDVYVPDLAVNVDFCSGACCWPDPSCTFVPPEVCSKFVCDVSDWLPDSFTGCLADVDGSGVVNASDRGFVSANIGEKDDILICLFDLDGSGVINASDRGFVSANIGQCAPLPDFQDGSGLNNGQPDPRYAAPTFMGSGTMCDLVTCP